MTISGWLQIVFFTTVLLLLTKPLGIYMALVLEGVGPRTDKDNTAAVTSSDKHSGTSTGTAADTIQGGRPSGRSTASLPSAPKYNQVQRFLDSWKIWSIWKFCRVSPLEDMTYVDYTLALLFFSLVSALFSYALLSTETRGPPAPQSHGFYDSFCTLS